MNKLIAIIVAGLAALTMSLTAPPAQADTIINQFSFSRDFQRTSVNPAQPDTCKVTIIVKNENSYGRQTNWQTEEFDTIGAFRSVRGNQFLAPGQTVRYTVTTTEFAGRVKVWQGSTQGAANLLDSYYARCN